MSNDAAMDAAEQSLRERWPELSAKEACNEAVAAIANATANQSTRINALKKISRLFRARQRFLWQRITIVFQRW